MNCYGTYHYSIAEYEYFKYLLGFGFFSLNYIVHLGGRVQCASKGQYLMQVDTDNAVCVPLTQTLLSLTLNQQLSENCLSSSCGACKIQVEK